MARPRVLLLTTTFPARADDATPRFVLELAEAMADDYDFTVLAPRVPGAQPRARMGRLDVVRFPYFPKRWERVPDGATLPNLHAQRWRMAELPPLTSLFMLHTWRLARHLRPDLVHAHWLLPCGMFGAVVEARLGVPMVVTAHGVDVHAWRREPFESARRWVVGHAAAIGTDSTELAAEVDDLGGAGRTMAIPMAVDVERMRAAVGRRTPVPGRFLFVGRLAAKKGVDVLLRAIAEVPGAELVVVGDGPDRARLEAEAAADGLDGRVRFVGSLGRDEVVARLREAYALVIPSIVAADGDRDGTPVVLSEGVAAGVPIIASRIAGIGERITDRVHGRLVEPSSVEELRGALQWALDHPADLEAMAQEASNTALKGIRLEDAAAGYGELYHRALAGEGRRG